jgi:hypothetical protein
MALQRMMRGGSHSDLGREESPDVLYQVGLAARSATSLPTVKPKSQDGTEALSTPLVFPASRRIALAARARSGFVHLANRFFSQPPSV